LWFCACLAVFSSSAAAQTTASATPPKTAADYAQEPIVYEHKRAVLRYENDGSGTNEVFVRMRVNTAAGLQKAGQLILNYNAANERLEIRSIHVVKPDGSATTVPPSAVQDLTAPVAREAPVYTDAMEKHVTIPSIAVGDVVEYSVFHTFQPLAAGQFLQTWDLVSDAISLDEQVELNVPRDRAVKLKSPPGVEPTVSDDGDRRVYHWKASNLETPKVDFQSAMKRAKFDPATLLRGAPQLEGRRILFSTFQSWDDVGRWYAGLEHDRRSVTNELRTKADEIVKGQTTDAGKAKALYAWVARNVRYVSLSFGLGRYQPHSAAEVLQNLYGDCKDKNTLLEALLEAEGIHAQAALLNSQGRIDSEVPSPLQFDHVITLAHIEGQDTWLDSTGSVIPYQYLLPQLRGVKALVVSGEDRSDLRETPHDLPFQTLYAVELTGSISKDKKMDLKFAMDTRGDLEALLRTFVLLVPPSQFNSLIQQAIAQNGKAFPKDVSIGDFKTGDPTDTEKPFHLEIGMATSLSDNTGSSTQEKSSPQKAAQAFVSGFRSRQELLLLLPVLEEKNTRVVLGGPKEYSLSLRLAFPPGVADASSEPANTHIERDFADYQFRSGWDGQTLVALWRLRLRVPEIPAEKSKEYADFSQQVVESLGGPSNSAVFASSASSKPATSSNTTHVPPEDAVSHYKEAVDEFKRHDYASAEQALLIAVEKDPAYEEAWRELGRTRMHSKKYEDAEAAFTKVLELAPDKWRSYDDVAWSLEMQKRYPDIVELLTKRFELGPDDGNGRFRLGRAYLLLHQPDRAVPELLKATQLLPRYRPAHFSLAEAYLELNQYDSAALSFNKAVEVDSSPSILNDAAYELAERKTHLELAESWSRRSISEVEQELNQLTLAQMPSETTARVNSLGPFWDTLGWIEFQKGDLNAAEKYLRAAWESADSFTMGYHMARLSEARKRDSEAAEIYAEALATLPPKYESFDVVKDARARLVTLLGDQSKAESRILESKKNLRARHMVGVPNRAQSIGIAQYLVIESPDQKCAELHSLIGEDPLPELAQDLRSITLPQSIPDDILKKFPRTVAVTCASPAESCTLVVLPMSLVSPVPTTAPQ
jgi:tetratricopeptide (TPR) repeat protein